MPSTNKILAEFNAKARSLKLFNNRKHLPSVVIEIGLTYTIKAFNGSLLDCHNFCKRQTNDKDYDIDILKNDYTGEITDSSWNGGNLNWSIEWCSDLDDVIIKP